MGRRKYLGKPYEKYIKTFDSKISRINDSNINGYISYLNIIKVKTPFFVNLMDRNICLYNDGYYELTFLPDNENWQVYGLYDNFGNIIEWYFDITRKNSLDENDKPYCDDLYLDIVLMPDGQIIILDEDELLDAYKNGKITKDEYELAYNVKNKLIKDGIVSINYMEKLFDKIITTFK